MEFDETSMLGEQLYEALAKLKEIERVTEEEIDPNSPWLDKQHAKWVAPKKVADSINKRIWGE